MNKLLLILVALVISRCVVAQGLAQTDDHPNKEKWWPKAQTLFCGDDVFFDLSDPYLDTEAMLNEITRSVPRFQWEKHAKFLRCGEYEMNILQYLTEGTFDITNRYFVVSIECLSQFEEQNISSSWSSKERIKCTSLNNEKHLANLYVDGPKDFPPKILELVNEVLDQDGLKLTLLDLVQQIIQNNKNTNPIATSEWITVSRYLMARGAMQYQELNQKVVRYTHPDSEKYSSIIEYLDANFTHIKNSKESASSRWQSGSYHIYGFNVDVLDMKKIYEGVRDVCTRTGYFSNLYEIEQEDFFSEAYFTEELGFSPSQWSALFKEGGSGSPRFNKFDRNIELAPVAARLEPLFKKMTGEIAYNHFGWEEPYGCLDNNYGWPRYKFMLKIYSSLIGDQRFFYFAVETGAQELDAHAISLRKKSAHDRIATVPSEIKNRTPASITDFFGSLINKVKYAYQPAGKIYQSGDYYVYHLSNFDISTMTDDIIDVCIGSGISSRVAYIELGHHYAEKVLGVGAPTWRKLVKTDTSVNEIRPRDVMVNLVKSQQKLFLSLTGLAEPDVAFGPNFKLPLVCADDHSNWPLYLFVVQLYQAQRNNGDIDYYYTLETNQKRLNDEAMAEHKRHVKFYLNKISN